MAELISILLLNAVVPASGTATAVYVIPRGDVWDLVDVFQNATSQSCFITDIRDSRGFHYTNASPQTPLPLGLFQLIGSPNISESSFPFPLHLEGDIVFYMDFKDASAAQNTVNVILVGKHTLAGGS